MLTNLQTKNNYNIVEFFLLKGIFSDKECEFIKEKSCQGQNPNPINLFPNTAYNIFSVKEVTHDSQNKWLFKKLNFHLHQLNKNYFKFQLTHLMNTQLCEFSQHDFLNWHVDIRDGYSFSRKLTIIINLSSPKDYEGGQIECFGYTNSQVENQTEPGTFIVFPSFIPYQIKPISKGSRTLLISWMHGPASFQ